jgi:allantoate deiminase
VLGPHGRGCLASDMHAHPQHEAAALQCAPELVKTLEEAITATTGAVLAPRIVSGAGHDGLALSSLGPVGMLFVRCRDGISHSPLEFAAKEDVDAAVTALTRRRTV